MLLALRSNFPYSTVSLLDMTTFYVLIADFALKISLFPSESKAMQKWFESYLPRYLAEFLLQKRPKKIDYYIDIKWDKKEEMIVREKENKYYLHLFTKKAGNRIITNYQISISQLQIVLRYALHSLLMPNSGFFIHASSLLIGGKAYIFVGRPGAGKSTAARLLQKRYPRLSDDIIVVKKVNKKFMVYQTPILEKNKASRKSKDAVPLGKIFLLKKTKIFAIEPVRNNMQTFEKMLKQVFATRNEDISTLAKTLTNLLAVQNIIQVLSFAKDEKKMLQLFKASIK